MLVYKNVNHNKGFTLIELLVAISLIGILSAVLYSVLNPQGIQAKARDSQRVSDLAKLKIALENYFSVNRSYPLAADWVPVSSISGITPDYMNALPSDPKSVGTICLDSNWRGYIYKSDGAKYVLATNMEVASMASEACPVSPVTYCARCLFTGGYAYFTSTD